MTEGEMMLAAAITVALLVGLLLGWLLWGRSAGSRRASLRNELDDMRTAMFRAEEARTRAERDLASAREQVRPLADQVDRLKAELDGAKRRLNAAKAALSSADAPGLPALDVPPAEETPPGSRPAPGAEPPPPGVAPLADRRGDALPQDRATTEPLRPELEVVDAVPLPASELAAATAAAGADDLRMLKGVGDKLNAKFAQFGILTVQDLAGLSDADAEALDRKLDQFSGRIARDQLLEQARLLAGGRLTEYEARFGRLGAP